MEQQLNEQPETTAKEVDDTCNPLSYHADGAHLTFACPLFQAPRATKYEDYVVKFGSAYMFLVSGGFKLALLQC